MIKKLIYPALSYKITGILFRIHNKLGRFCREKQYQDAIEKFLKEGNFKFEREKKILLPLGIKGNQVDFLIEDRILLECKAKPFTTKEDYYQLLRYLKASGKRLGLIVNFRNKYLKPRRIAN